MSFDEKGAFDPNRASGGFSDVGRIYDASPETQGFSRFAGAERDWRIYCAYGESLVLRKFSPHYREPWSISRLPRLADVLGPWRRHDVANIDLPSLLKVDEWCECEAQLRVRRKSLTEAETRELKTDIAWQEMQLADCPADTIFGVIAKLMIWRRKNAESLKRDLASDRLHALAFSAYTDLIRLTGLFALAIEADREFDDHFQFR
jgi:hypothetical protein